jgi:hypothetical protein
MPTVTQERGVKSIKGLPLRWGVKAYRELQAARGNPFEAVPEHYKTLSKLVDQITDAPVSLDSTDAAIIIFANQIAHQCAGQKDSLINIRRTLDKVGIEEPDYGVNEPGGFILRACDPAWVRRQLRKIHGRKFEHAAIRLGFVSSFAGAYASNETVQRRIAQNFRNKKILESVTLENQNGQSFTLAQLASKGTANKAIRRGELMLRMRGMETIATESGHVGVFVTLTCPSKYHGTLWGSGTTNPKYNNATPREAQAYLQGVWQCIRAKCSREKIQPYGFRIAEPHHDGCPHWHLLLFVALDHAGRFSEIMHEYALAEDGTEPGAAKNRVKIVRIEAGKGTAAGYIAKYVSKNIDAEHVASHTDDDGSVIEQDLIGDEVIKPCQRVEAWAAQWGIRQFQSIGAPPITVWREMRRVAMETVQHAPAHIRAAWSAAQKIDGMEGQPAIKQADFAEYIRAQGGVHQGRKYRIGIATAVQVVEGRYGVTEQPKPIGIYSKAQPRAVYESTRYRWIRKAVAGAFDLPRTCVNNCTGKFEPVWEKDTSPAKYLPEIDDSGWFESDTFGQMCREMQDSEIWLEELRRKAEERRTNTVFTQPIRRFHARKNEGFVIEAGCTSGGIFATGF